MTGQPIRIITYAWGEKYVETLLSLTLPAMLAPGNLPDVAAAPCDVVILTQERFFASVSGSRAVSRIRALCPVRLIGLDDLVTTPDKYGMTLTYALHRGFADLGAAMTEHWLLFLNADFILAAGSWRHVLTHLADGQRLVAAPSYCVKSHDVVGELRRRMDTEASTLSVAPRAMADLVLRHRHNTIRGKTVNEREFSIRYMDQFYWQVDERTLIGHQMPVAIVGMRPERHVREPQAFWDYGLMREFCPQAGVHVLGDSDEFLMMELRDKEVAAEQVVAGWPSAREIGELMVTWVTPYQRAFAHRPLTLHAGEVPAGIDEARSRLRSFVDDVLSHAPADLPSHVDHPQWRYHYPAFMVARHHYLSVRLGSATETSPPSEELSEIDRAWWQLDGLEKAHARRCGEIVGRAAHRRRLIQAAAARRAARLAHPPAGTPGDEGSGPSPALFPHLVMSRSGEGTIRHWPSVARALERIDARERRGLQALTDEFEPVHREFREQYERHLARPVAAAGVRAAVHHGPIAATLRSPAQLQRELPRWVYHRLVGQLPRVRRLHPYWAAMRHIVRIVDAEAARGARDVLSVTASGAVTASIADHFPGLHAGMPIADVRSGRLSAALNGPLTFDLCVCELGVGDLSVLSEILCAVRPFIRPGGTMVAFHLNLTGEPAPLAVPSGLPGCGDKAHVYYAGSPASARVLRDFQAAASTCRSRGARAVARGAVALLAVMPRALLANRREATRPMNDDGARAGSWTSVTVEVTV